jgi:hypothetical protein
LERKEIILTPGKEISDVAPELLSDMQWSRVENLYSDKVGRFVPLRGLDNKLPDTIRYYRTTSVKVVADSILNGIEWNNYLFLVVKSSTYINLVRLKKSGESYILGWNDGTHDVCFSYFARDDSFIEREDLGTKDIQFIPYAHELRVRIGSYVNCLADYSGKTIKTFSGDTITTYGVNHLTENSSTYYSTMESRKVVSTYPVIGDDPIRLYRNISSTTNFHKYRMVEYHDLSVASHYFSFAVKLAAIYDDGQMGLMTIGEYTNYINEDGDLITRPSILSTGEIYYTSSDFDELKIVNSFGFDIQLEPDKLPSKLSQVMVFVATRPDVVDIDFSDNTGLPEREPTIVISEKENKNNWRLLKTIQIDNKLTFDSNNNVIASIPIRYDAWTQCDAPDLDEIRFFYHLDFKDESIAKDVITKLIAGHYIMLSDKDGNEQGPLRIDSVTNGSLTTPYNDDYVKVTLDDDINALFLIGGVAGEFKDAVYIDIVESPIDLTTFDTTYVKYHLDFNLKDLGDYPLWTDVFPYNAAANIEEYYPDLTDFLIWQKQGYAKTSEFGEEYFLRYAVNEYFDIFPPDQVHEVALEGIQNIVPLNDRLIIIGQKGITQGNILSQDFYLEFLDSTAGIIRPGAYVVHNGILYFMSDQDVYAFNGNTVQSVLKNSMIKNYYRDNIKEAEGFIVYSKYYSGLIIFMSETKGLLINDFGTSRWALDENMIFAITDSDGDMVLFDDSASGFKIDPTDVYSDEYYLEAKELNERAFSAKQLTDVFIDTSYEGDIEVVSKDLRTNVTSNIVRAVDSTFGIEKRMSPRLIFNALSLNFEFTDSVGDFEIGRIRLWLKNLGR